ncbi:MAG: sugar phosphate isomerase/epimerase family protein [Promethearchaeota archaeon]
MRKVGATLYKAIQKKFGFRELLSFLSETKFTFVELYLPDEELITSELNFNKEKLQDFNEIVACYDFGISVHGLYDNYNGIISNLADLDDTLRKKAIQTTKKSIELCNLLNSQVLVIHPGTLFPYQKRKKSSSMNKLAAHPLDRPKGVKNIQNSIMNLLEHAEDFGVVLCLENEVPRFETIPLCDNPFTLIQLCQALFEQFSDSFCGATLDLGHLALECTFYGFDLLQTVKAFQPYIKHIHFHDNLMIPCPLGGTKADKGYGDLHYPIGDGSIPYTGISPLLKNIKVDTVFNFEIFRIKKIDDFKPSKQFVDSV